MLFLVNVSLRLKNQEKKMFKKSVIGVILFICLLQGTKTTENLENSSNDQVSTLLKRIGVLETEIQRLKQNSGYIYTNVTESVKQGNFRLANELIALYPHELTANAWFNLMNEVYGSHFSPIDLLARYGASMKLSTTKLMFYLAFKRFVEEKNREGVSSLARSSVDSEEENLMIEPIESLKKFEEHLQWTLGKVFEESLIRNVDPEAAKILQKIEWDKLAEEEISHTKEQKLTVIQQLFNETVAQIYFHLNLDELIDRIESKNCTLEKNKIYKVQLCGALRYAISVKSNNQNPYLFKLAYTVRDHIKYNNHEIAKEYFEGYLKRLAESFHGCIRGIINEPNETGFLIKSIKYNEYIYTVMYAATAAWKNIPNDLKSNFYPIFAWIPKNMDETGQFFLETENRRFWIRSGKFPEKYIDTSHDTVVHSPVNGKRLQKTAVHIIPSDRDDENCYIQNWNTEKFMFAGADSTNEDSSRRRIFSNGEKENQDESFLWNFSSFRKV